jgi:hypothetical protein
VIIASALLGVMALGCAIRQPMKSIALARSRSSRFFEQQAGRTFNSSPKLVLASFYLRNSSGSLAKLAAMRRAWSLLSSLPGLNYQNPQGRGTDELRHPGQRGFSLYALKRLESRLRTSSAGYRARMLAPQQRGKDIVGMLVVRRTDAVFADDRCCHCGSLLVSAGSLPSVPFDQQH